MCHLVCMQLQQCVLKRNTQSIDPNLFNCMEFYSWSRDDELSDSCRFEFDIQTNRYIARLFVCKIKKQSSAHVHTNEPQPRLHVHMYIHMYVRTCSSTRVSLRASATHSAPYHQESPFQSVRLSQPREMSPAPCCQPSPAPPCQRELELELELEV